jgi:Xaa-Pro aminopeptidase
MDFGEPSRFTSEFFSGNRQHLRELFTGTAPIVVTASGLLQRGGDTTYKFEQDANFWYLTGVNEPDIILVMDQDNEYLIVPERSVSRKAFDGDLSDEVLSRRSGIRNIYDEVSGWDRLSSRLKKVKHVATIAPSPAYIEPFGLYTNPARSALTERLKATKENIKLLDLAPHLVRMRMIKQPVELQAIQAAIDITVSSLKDSLKTQKLRKYVYEYELEAEISYGFRRRGASGISFDPIVAGGARACMLHYMENNSALAADELIIIDVGAQVEHYMADIARTVSQGSPSRRQQAVYDAVLEAQRFAFDYLKPGIMIKDYELQLEQFVGEKLRELNLIKIIDRNNVRAFFPHATSHFLGLTSHDAGDYGRPLEPGVILAVEPGIYIQKEGIGVRIEDNVLITADGNKILSDKLPRSLC